MIEPLRVLIADDEAHIREVLLRTAQGHGHRVEAVADGAAAIAALRRGPVDLVFTDLKMPEADGFAVLDAARAAAPDVTVIVMTAFGTMDTAIEAMRRGAADFLIKPFSLDLVELQMDRLVDARRLRTENTRLRRLADRGDAAPTIVGTSAGVRRVLELVEAVAPSDSTVLVLGESGTGKELVARAVHAGSPRAAARFVAVNCAALSASLLESEIFGHEAGAFTGAVKRKIGLLEAATGGTFFLDEVAETAPDLQAKLLRVLQEREFYRVGGTDPIKTDVRFVAATNRDPATEIAEGRFREDLFYRLNVFPIALPPLRDRREDLGALATHILAQLGRRLGRSNLVLGPEAVARLQAYAWPGNVRELQNALERGALLARDGKIRAEDLPGPSAGATPGAGLPVGSLTHLPLREARERLERDYVSALLRELSGNVSEASRRSGLGRSAFHDMLRRLALDPATFRTDGGPSPGSATR